MDDILNQAARLFNITRAELVGPSRAQHITQARQALAYALRTDTALSLVEIGKLLGGKDHTTILWSIAAAEQRACADPHYALTLSALLRR